jgi:RNA polymerase sigma-70 factor (ECF subfamily)
MFRAMNQPAMFGPARMMSELPDEFIPTRKSLLSRLKRWDDNDSWRDFFNTYWKLIYAVARKADLSHTEAEDVVQETVLAVARSIGRFKYDPAVCSFKSWLMQVTRSKIANQFQKRKRHPWPPEPVTDAGPGTPLLERLADPAGPALDAVWEEEWQKNLLEAAIQKVKRRVPIEQYQIFDFYVLKKWPARKVAQTLRVSLGQVYLARHRVSGLIKKEVELLEKKEV